MQSKSLSQRNSATTKIRISNYKNRRSTLTITLLVTHKNDGAKKTYNLVNCSSCYGREAGTEEVVHDGANGLHPS
jgi:hypothetical protein